MQTITLMEARIYLQYLKSMHMLIQTQDEITFQKLELHLLTRIWPFVQVYKKHVLVCKKHVIQFDVNFYNGRFRAETPFKFFLISGCEEDKVKAWQAR
jgi:hypothetical protein